MAGRNAGDLILGRYRLETRFGTGGAGTVWRARDTRLGRPVAVKILSKRLRRAAEAVAEARTVAGLADPHIVALYEFVEDDTHFYLVTEAVDGASLEAVLGKGAGPLASDEAAAVLAPIARALGAAHRAGVVHGDVKSANILLGHEGQVKLADFGAAAFARTSGRRTGDVEASPAYAAPEILDGGLPAAAADLYSLGATLARAVGGSGPRAPLPKHVSSALRTLISELTAHHPQDRPPDAETVADDLELFGSGVDRRSLVKGLVSQQVDETTTAPGEAVAREAPPPRFTSERIARLWPAALIGFATLWAVGTMAGTLAWGVVPGLALAVLGAFQPWAAGIVVTVLAGAALIQTAPVAAVLVVVTVGPLWILFAREDPRPWLGPALPSACALIGAPLVAAPLLAKTLRPSTALLVSAIGAVPLPALVLFSPFRAGGWTLTTLYAGPFWSRLADAYSSPGLLTEAAALPVMTAILALVPRRQRWVGPAAVIASVVGAFALIEAVTPGGGVEHRALADLSLSLIIGAVVMAAAPVPGPDE